MLRVFIACAPVLVHVNAAISEGNTPIAQYQRLNNLVAVLRDVVPQRACRGAGAPSGWRYESAKFALALFPIGDEVTSL